MKAEVILRSQSRRFEHNAVVGRDPMCVAMETQEEPHSPSDFINKNSPAKDNISTRTAYCSEATTPSLSSPPLPVVTMTTSTSQSVIRPIPILPLDTSIYSTPPIYIDNLPPTLTVPMVPPLLLGNHMQHSKKDVLEPTLSQTISSHNAFPKSPTSSDSSTSGQSLDLYDCRWIHCEAQFSCMDDLVTHVNDYHVRVERADTEYQCKWGGCPRQGKGFNARYKMLIHIRTHTNEKPHKCALCGKSFSRLENLKIHMRSHTGEKPYTCPFEGCNKAYSNSSDRFKHVRTHQEDKPYICKMPGCNKRYTDPSSLRKHVRTHGHYVKECNTKSCSSSSHQAIGSCINSMPHSSIIDVSRCPSALSTNISKGKVIVPISVFSRMTETLNNAAATAALHSSGLHSNPLLSSAIISVPKHTISTQTDGLPSLGLHMLPVAPISCLDSTDSVHSDLSKDEGQDSPLDLSTASPDHVCASDAEYITSVADSNVKLEVLPQDMVRWEVTPLTS